MFEAHSEVRSADAPQGLLLNGPLLAELVGKPVSLYQKRYSLKVLCPQACSCHVPRKPRGSLKGFARRLSTWLAPDSVALSM